MIANRVEAVEGLPQKPVSKPTEKQLFSLLNVAEREKGPTDSSITWRVFILTACKDCHQNKSPGGNSQQVKPGSSAVQKARRQRRSTREAAQLAPRTLGRLGQVR